MKYQLPFQQSQFHATAVCQISYLNLPRRPLAAMAGRSYLLVLSLCACACKACCATSQMTKPPAPTKSWHLPRQPQKHPPRQSWRPPRHPSGPSERHPGAPRYIIPRRDNWRAGMFNSCGFLRLDNFWSRIKHILLLDSMDPGP